MSSLSFKFRSELTKNELAKKIFIIMEEKQSNLCYSADLNDKSKLLNIVSKIGLCICVLKLHCDIIENFDNEFITNLLILSKKLNFVIIEDRKFCDIGKTFIDQYTKGVFKIRDWSDLITVNCLAGNGIIESFNKLNNKSNKGMLLIFDLSTNSLIEDYYKKNVFNYTQNSKYENSITGVITQKNEIKDNRLLYFTPGVNINVKSDNLDQNYRTPDDAIVRDNCDIIIVGRGITNSQDPVKTTISYKNIAWNSYLKKIN